MTHPPFKVLTKDACILYAEKHGLSQWAHGHHKDQWKWTDDAGCYYYNGPNCWHTPPNSYCLGDR